MLEDCGLSRTNASLIPQYGTAIDMPFDEQRLLRTPSGTALNLFIKNAGQDARAIVQINHGLAEHAGRYAAFADFLAGQGFHVYAQDHRGHGLTRAEDALPGMFARKDGVKKVIADVASVHDLIAKEHPGRPVILFGRSIGGLIALGFLRERARPVAGAAIWDYPEEPLPARMTRLLLAWERFRLGSDAPSHLLPRFTFDVWADAIPDRRTPFDWLSRDPAAVDAFIADPLCGWAPSVSMWSDMIALFAELSKPGAFDPIDRALPFHLAGGGADPVTDHGNAVLALAKRLHRQGFSNLSSRIYAGNRHDCLNDAGGLQIMEDFAAWIDHSALAT